MLTVTPSAATSLASVREKPVTAARMLFDSIRLSTGCLAAIDVMWMIAPPSSLAHPGQHGARELDGAAQRQIHRALPRVPVVLLERAGGRAAGIGDENVDAAECARVPRS